MPEIIRGPLAHCSPDKPVIALQVEREKLAKRRWRAAADDGRDFGFDLERPLRDGDLFFETQTGCYRIAQIPELVLELPFDSAHHPERWALVGWNIGNLHFPIEIAPTCLRVADDPALRNLFEREQLTFVETLRVFRPATSASSHGHHPH